jgi:hypothetical protein
MPDLTFTSQGAAQAARDLEGINRSAEEMKRLFAEDARAAKDLELAVARIIKSKDGAAQFNREVASLTAQFKNGKLDVEQYNAALNRLNNAYSESQGLQNKVTQGVGGFVSVLGKFAGPAAIGSLAIKTFSEMESSAQAAADAIYNAQGSMGELLQLTNKPGDFAKLTAEADEIFARGIGQTRDQAALTAFQLNSSGMNEQEKAYLLGLLEKGLVAPQNVTPLVGAIGTYRDAFGAGETGTVKDIIDKFSVAGGPTRGSLQEIADSAAGLGQLGKDLGFSDEETLAALSLASIKTGNIAKAQPLVQGLFKTIIKNNLKKGSLFETLQAIQGNVSDTLPLLGEGDKGALGTTDLEAYRGFLSIMQSPEKYKELLSGIESAPRRNVAQAQASRSSESPEFEATQARRRAEARSQLGENTTVENLFEAIINERYEKRAKSYGRFAAKLGGSLNWLTDFTDLESGDIAEAAYAEPGYYSPELQRQAQEWIRRNNPNALRPIGEPGGMGPMPNLGAADNEAPQQTQLLQETVTQLKELNKQAGRGGNTTVINQGGPIRGGSF